jgi:hypothetical protein
LAGGGSGARATVEVELLLLRGVIYINMLQYYIYTYMRTHTRARP